jgi:hypothetical protein
MKTQINVTSNNWTQEIVQALRYVYRDHENPGHLRTGCTLTLERENGFTMPVSGLSKLDKTIEENLDTNLVIIYNNEMGEQTRVDLLPTDKIYLTQ